MTNLRVVFAGSPAAAVPSLLAIARSGYDIAAVITREDALLGRKRIRTPTPVALDAHELGIPVIAANSLAGEPTERILRLQPDLGVIVAYGGLVREPLLSAPKLGWINLHFSVLPRWRGAAPVQRAILAGDTETGVMVMQMEAGLDTGPVRASAATPVDGKTAGELTAELAEMGARLMVDVLGDLDRYLPVAQPGEGVTYARKIEKSEARLDFHASAGAVERQIRAFNPVPGAFFEYAGERYRVLAAEISPLSPAAPGNREGLVLDDRLAIACADGAIRPMIIQRAGKPAMPLADFLRGNAIPAGTRLS